MVQSAAQSRPRALARSPATVLMAPTRPASALALQRSAGNRATARCVADRPILARSRSLDRCGAGGCSCGGMCGGHAADDELEALGSSQLRRAVLSRAAAELSVS